MSSKKILEKLVNIVGKQQQMLTKLAQAQDPNVALIKQVADSVAAKFAAQGMPLTTQVSVNPPPANTDPSVTVSQGYTLKVSGLKNDNMKNSFKGLLNNALKAQKPELLDVLSVFYV